MYKEMKKIQAGNQSLINPFQLNAYQKASISQQTSLPTVPNFEDHAIGNTHIFFGPTTVSYYVMSLTALYEANLYNMISNTMIY
jgi:hypothetical protein